MADAEARVRTLELAVRAELAAESEFKKLFPDGLEFASDATMGFAREHATKAARQVAWWPVVRVLEEHLRYEDIADLIIEGARGGTTRSGFAFPLCPIYVNGRPPTIRDGDARRARSGDDSLRERIAARLRADRKRRPS